MYNWLISDLGDIIASFLNLVFWPLATINLNVAVPFVRGVMNFFKAALCLLPVGTISSVLSIVLIYFTIRLLVNIIRTVWELIPWL